MKKLIIWLCLMLLLMNPIASYGDLNGPYRDGFIEGYVKAIYEQEIAIEEYDGTVHRLSFDPKAALTIDSVPVTLKDFKPGMEVYGDLKGKRLNTLESFSTDNPGYIPPGGKVRTGIVRTIDRDQITIQTAIGTKETYFSSPATIALKKGANISLSSLYEGDRVKLYFDEMDANFISRMEIEGDSILVKDLYRGKLTISNQLDNQIVLENVERIRNGKWEDVQATMSIPYTTDLPLYSGGQKISYQNLKYYKGKTVYMAVKDFFGKNRAEKMIIKGQYESDFSDKIEDVNWYTQALELGNNRNLNFHEGTIIVKNGRLVDIYGINAKADAFVVADGRGSTLTADVIYLYNEDINNSNIGQYNIYAGRLDVILESTVTLKNFYVLNQNEWESFSKEKELYYDNDTFIYDLENGKKVAPKEFYAKDYAVDEDTDYASDRGLKDWHGYIYTDGDRICGIVVQKKLDSLLRQRTSNGVIEKIEDDALLGWTMYIKDGKDWSARKEQWMAKNSTFKVTLDEALIMKDDKVIQPDELKPGDRLYIVRDDMEGKVVLVK
ncbi:hypothetical protein HNQ80_001683 [Anaerosolibacter carboniphilus]|uniref:Uncharacterized protein n=1 Tax=Anaerosolibacter carboniphilus TaxID=1417629 RepID=A0A841KP83_9FIRM|nr:hypothetical protein [Anaerosolibacter carboniphilus]MBB6215594.1 hypothetical protein [Anaerosolibacter carboniphilus]